LVRERDKIEVLEIEILEQPDEISSRVSISCAVGQQADRGIAAAELTHVVFGTVCRQVDTDKYAHPNAGLRGNRLDLLFYPGRSIVGGKADGDRGKARCGVGSGRIKSISVVHRALNTE
jgi:hypothetical protein